jgi:hypothetical protein
LSVELLRDGHAGELDALDDGRRVAIKAPERALAVEVTGGREEHGALRAWNEGVVAGADRMEVD